MTQELDKPTSSIRKLIQCLAVQPFYQQENMNFHSVTLVTDVSWMLPPFRNVNQFCIMLGEFTHCLKAYSLHGFLGVKSSPLALAADIAHSEKAE